LRARAGLIGLSCARQPLMSDSPRPNRVEKRPPPQPSPFQGEGTQEAADSLTLKGGGLGWGSATRFNGDGSNSRVSYVQVDPRTPSSFPRKRESGATDTAFVALDPRFRGDDGVWCVDLKAWRSKTEY